MTETTTYTLVLTEKQHHALHSHLFHQDDCEAIAFALCGRRADMKKHKLLVREIHPIPYKQCSKRTPVRLKWSTTILPPLIEKAMAKGWSVLKIHSHPNLYPYFSRFDDAADQDIFCSIHGWTDNNFPHTSAIMFPDGKMIGRIIDQSEKFLPLQAIHVIGDNLCFWFDNQKNAIPEFGIRISQTFGKGTYTKLSKLKIAVVGCSGTGSIVIEQLARNCIGELVLVDPDIVEEKNLNRLPNTTMQDAIDKRAKVNVFARSIKNMGFGTKVTTIQGDLAEPKTMLAVAGCDVVFGCMDSIEGRHILNRLASFYILPYFDLGVKLVADGTGNVEEVDQRQLFFPVNDN